MATFSDEFYANCELAGGLAVRRGPFTAYDDAADAATADEVPVSVNEDGEEITGEPVAVLAFSIAKRAVRDQD